MLFLVGTDPSESQSILRSITTPRYAVHSRSGYHKDQRSTAQVAVDSFCRFLVVHGFGIATWQGSDMHHAVCTNDASLDYV